MRREELEEEAGLLSFLFPLSRDPFFNTALSIFLFPPRKRVKGATRDAEKKRRIKGADGDDG